MAYVLAFPPSASISPRDIQEDARPPGHSSASSSSAYYPHSSNHPHTSQEMGKSDKGPISVDIVVASDTLVLRGTGVDVAPALLSGNVVLNLSEATSIREISLSFRGKAKIPPSASES